MTDDDDIGFDLSAWEAPEAGGNGLADAVIARVRERDITSVGGVAAVEPVSRRPRYWIAGAIASAVAMAGIVVFAVRGSPEELAGLGAVATDRPTHVDLGGGTTAELDPATTLIWVRDGRRVVAMQGRGAATWRVDSDDTVQIDAGATVASVVASGASLRVEVEMNLSEAKTIGVTAVAAAAIATLVTVMVYNGKASVSGNDHAVTVTPGNTIAVRAGEIPGLDVIGRGVAAQRAEIEQLIEKLNRLDADRQRAVDELEQLKKGDSNLVALRKQLAEKEAAIDALNARVRVLGGGPVVPPTQITAGCDAAALVKKADTTFSMGGFAQALATYQQALKCRTDLPTINKAFVAACRSKNTAIARSLYAKVSNKSLAQACLAEGIDVENDFVASPFLPVKPTPNVAGSNAPPANVCADPKAVEAVSKEGESLMSQGSYGAALGKFERIIKCDSKYIKYAYLAACRSKVFTKAKKYWVAAGSQPNLAQICMKEGYDPRSSLPPP